MGHEGTWSRVKALHIQPVGCVLHGQLVHTDRCWLFLCCGEAVGKSTAYDATVKIQSTFSLIHEAEIQTSWGSSKMLHGQKFDPCKRTFFMKRAGHLFKENSHCSMFGALCPSNKLLVCADLKRSAKKLENLFCSKVLYMYLPFGLFISSTYYIYNVYILYMYTCRIAYTPADGLPQARHLHSLNRPLSLSWLCFVQLACDLSPLLSEQQLSNLNHMQEKRAEKCSIS